MLVLITASCLVSSGGEASLVVRYTDSANFYWLGLGLYNHKYSIAEVVDGVYEELNSTGLDTEVELGKGYTVTVVTVCSSLNCLLMGLRFCRFRMILILTGLLALEHSMLQWSMDK
ncbi:MAG: hypothetical protein QG670_1702 [Thermoproteota archaeon]|nr:hypothetical protein [Thermoproteota archaeon]